MEATTHEASGTSQLPIINNNNNNNNRSEWRTIQGIIVREICVRGRFEITSTITPELYDTKSYYQLIVTIS